MLTHSLQLPNQCSPTPDLLTCGIPSARDLQQACEAGFKTVVNLCPAPETSRDEPATVANLGMRYVNIPVAGPTDLTEAKARELGAVVNECANHPVIIHCASGNRVGALLALKAFYVDGKSPQEALALGLAGGLKALEPYVAQLLQQAARKT